MINESDSSGLCFFKNYFVLGEKTIEVLHLDFKKPRMGHGLSGEGLIDDQGAEPG